MDGAGSGSVGVVGGLLAGSFDIDARAVAVRGDEGDGFGGDPQGHVVEKDGAGAACGLGKRKDGVVVACAGFVESQPCGVELAAALFGGVDFASDDVALGVVGGAWLDARRCAQRGEVGKACAIGARVGGRWSSVYQRLVDGADFLVKARLEGVVRRDPQSGARGVPIRPGG